MKREEQVFEQVLAEASPTAREDFLRRACAGDTTLRRQVEELLAAHDDAAQLEFLEATRSGGQTDTARTDVEPTETPGSSLGRYKLLEKLGEGGCGVVYMAEQEEPVRRKVALKILKPGMDSRQVIARFEAERQALALMDHPNIARVFDGGVIGDAIEPPIVESPVPIPVQSKIANRKSQIAQGRPYFVMELVGGIRITDYCVQKNLSTHQRLHLFVAVCHAVQHAHQKGIIHRDLKPSNILVTENDGKPVPKVIDFGIAKATEQKLTEKTVFTQFAQFLGTPAYMSPEQAAMTSVDIDTRSDIYSLGVLLYELLTGTTPFDTQELLKAGFDEMRRVIRETEPDRPSTRLTMARTTMAAAPPLQSQLANQKSKIDPDLDWIVMKCLEKDRSRRYETANGLAADLQRHLNCEPVTARPPSAAYRFQKLVRRNRVGFAAGSAVMAALIVGLSLAVWQSIERTRAYRRALAAEQAQTFLRQQAEANARMAQDEAIKSQQVSKFLKDMLRGVRPSVARGRDTAMLREILDRTTRRLSNSLKERPEVQAEILSTLAHSHEDLGLVDEAEKMYREVLRLYESIHGRDHPSVAGALVDLSSVLNHPTQAEDTETLNREALGIYRKHYGSNHLAVVPALINIALARGKRDDTTSEEAFYREAIGLYDQHPGREDADLAFALYNLAAGRHNQGDYAEASSLSERAAAIYRALPDNSSDLAKAAQLAGQSSYRRRDYASAEQFLRESLAIRRERYGPVDERTVDAQTWLALTLAATGANEEGAALVRGMVIAEQKLWAAKPDRLSEALAGDADLFFRFGQFSEAEPLYRDRLRYLRQRLPAGHKQVLEVTASLGRLLSEWAWAGRSNSTPGGVATPASRFGDTNSNAQAAHRAREAEALLQDCLALRLRDIPAAPWRIADTRSRLGFALAAVAVTDPALDREARIGKLREAEQLLLEGNEVLQQSAEAEFKHRRDALTRLVRLHQAWDEITPNSGHALKVAEWKEKLVGLDHRLTAQTQPSGADP